LLGGYSHTLNSIVDMASARKQGESNDMGIDRKSCGGHPVFGDRGGEPLLRGDWGKIIGASAGGLHVSGQLTGCVQERMNGQKADEIP
jgi:hypothetical protein